MMKYKVFFFKRMIWIGGFLILSACSRNEIEFIDSDTNAEIRQGLVDIEFKVDDATSTTKSLSNFGSGRYVTVMAYFHGSNPATPPVQTKQYTSSPGGKLIPITSNMRLITGNYDFYAVSTTSLSNRTPLFIQNISQSLTNGTDYLWAKTENMNIIGNTKTIPISFHHECSEIVINLTETFFTFIHFIDDAYIMVPAGKATMNLDNGNINITTSSATQKLPMQISDNNCRIILFPYKEPLQLKVVFKIWVNLNWDYKLFSTEIPIPGYSLEPGIEYKYKAIIDDNIFDLKEDK
ncbi:MAG: fimbrillin family protein [Bacteroidales bacterium]